MLLNLILSSAFAACPQLYGKQNPGGDWSFSSKQEAGMLPVDSDEKCRAQAGAYILQSGKYVLNAALLSAKESGEAAADKNVSIVKEDRVHELELRVEALEKALGK